MAKGGVAGLVGFARRNFMVPVPRFATWDAFNLWLREPCRKRQIDILRGHDETIGHREVWVRGYVDPVVTGCGAEPSVPTRVRQSGG